MVKCKACGVQFIGTHLCEKEKRPIRDDDGDFVMSVAIGALTNSAILGGLLGGDLIGGIVGDLMNGGLDD